MNALNKMIVAVGCALPLLASAQTTTSPNVKPADQPRSQLEKEQTQQNGQATKYPGPASDSGGAMSKDDSTHAGMKQGMKDKTKAGTTAAPVGAVSSYPAPTRDGTPTSPSTTK